MSNISQNKTENAYAFWNRVDKVSNFSSKELSLKLEINYRTMLDMKITGADTAQRYSYDGIMLIYYRRLPFFCEAKLSLLDICKCFHLNDIYKYYYSR